MGIAELAAFLLTKRPEYLINRSWLVLPGFQNGSIIQGKRDLIGSKCCQVGQNQPRSAC